MRARFRWATKIWPLRATRLGLAMAALGGLLIAPSAEAQDSHYWTNQYGNEARLLGGAVVGSSRDLAAVFYNPGRLALVARPEFVIAGNVFEYGWSILKAKETGTKSTSSRFALSPSLLAGELRFGFLGKNGRLAYSFLTRQYSDVRLNDGAVDRGLINADISSQVDHRLSEYWAGFTYANKLGDNLGVGASMFVVPRSHRSTTEATAFFTAGDDAVVDGISRSYEYNQWSLLWKLGVGTTIDVWDVGLTVTTPQVRLFGSGQTSGQFVDIDNFGGVTQIASDFQDGLATKLKSPWSVAVGGSRSFGRNAIHVTLEYFAPIAPYKVLEAEPTVPQIGGGAPLDLSVIDARQGTLNFALGFERRHSDGLTFYGSFHSDFSDDDPDGDGGMDPNLAFTRWDLWHVGGGIRTRLGDNEFTVGAVYAFSSADSTRGLGLDVASKYKRITVILGFNLPFGDNPTPG
jgi:hypothetical protein